MYHESIFRFSDKPLLPLVYQDHTTPTHAPHPPACKLRENGERPHHHHGLLPLARAWSGGSFRCVLCPYPPTPAIVTMFGAWRDERSWSVVRGLCSL